MPTKRHTKNVGDLQARMELRKLFDLNPKITPDRTGLEKLNGLLKDASGPKKFDAVDFLDDIRGK